MTEIETVAHVIPASQVALDDADEARRIVARRRRILHRLSVLGQQAFGHPFAQPTLRTPALEEAMERGVRADSAEWQTLVVKEAHRAATKQTTARARAVAVLDRYNRLVAAGRERREREAQQKRAEIRCASTFRPVTLKALTDRLGITPAFARHLVQPYCQCSDTYGDGWDLCGHALDAGLTSAYTSS